MNITEHKKYLKEFKAFGKKVTSSQESSKQFLIDAGIHTPTGRLKKPYKRAKALNKV